MDRCDALVLGIGNVLWADEGFGVRVVEALHAAFAFPAGVSLVDGGTLGLGLYEVVGTARRVLVFDAIDFGLPPGRSASCAATTCRVGSDQALSASERLQRRPRAASVERPRAGDDHRNRRPATGAVGFRGSLTKPVSQRLPEVVALAAAELRSWGLPGTPRAAGARFDPLNARSLSRDEYESGRPSNADACRRGDPRLVVQTTERKG